MPKKSAIVVHSGGMDSSICLALAVQEFGVSNVLSLNFDYGQRHQPEIVQAKKICKDWGVDQVVLEISCLAEITDDALVNSSMPIQHSDGEPPNTLVVGRNGLMGRVAAIQAHSLGANCICMGVIEVESASSGYRDCSRDYMDRLQDILRLDLDNPHFEIRTPLVKMTKCETMELAHRLGILNYLLEETITCYEGVRYRGCEKCPSCQLRNQGIAEFLDQNPGLTVPECYTSAVHH